MPSMDLDNFNLGARHLARTPDSKHLEAVRRYLVDGDSPTQLAVEYGISRQWIYKLGKLVKRSALDNDGIPPGFERVEVIVPHAYVRVVKAIEKECQGVISDEDSRHN